MLAKVFKELYENELKRDMYVEKIPSDIRMSIVDNEFTASLEEERSMLIKLLFKEYTESIEWFLYEWKPGYEVGIDNVMTKINNIDEYISWMQENEGFPKD